MHTICGTHHTTRKCNFDLYSTLLFQKQRTDAAAPGTTSMTDTITKRMQSFPYTSQLYDAEVPESGVAPAPGLAFASKLGLKLPNLAPDVDETPLPLPTITINPVIPMIKVQQESQNLLEPKKKKYAKEAWPGKKPTHSLLV